MNLKSGYPYSLIRNGLVFDYPKLGKNISTHTLIVGGGISGALTGWQLINEGIDTVIVDARSIGLGSTCASTSLLQYEIDTPLYRLSSLIGEKNAVTAYRCCLDSIARLHTVAKDIGFRGMERRKSLYLAATKKDTAWLKEDYEIRKRHGFRVHYLEAASLLKETGIDAPGAILSNDAAQTDAYLFTHQLHQAGMKKGLRVFDRTKIASVDHHPRGVIAHTEEGFTIRAKKLVYATGYEVTELIQKPIVKLQSTYATISEPLPAGSPFWKDHWLIWNTADPYLYMRIVDNRILVGGRDEKFYSPGRRDKLVELKTKKLVRDFNKLFPEITFIPEFSWTGTFGTTQDGLPFIGAYPPFPHSYFALGFGGNGITFSQVAADRIAAMIKRKKIPDAHLFSFDRI